MIYLKIPGRNNLMNRDVRCLPTYLSDDSFSSNPVFLFFLVAPDKEK